MSLAAPLTLMPRNLHRIASRLYCEPWLIRKDKHASLITQFRAASQSRMKVTLNCDDDDGEDGDEPIGMTDRLNHQADMDCLSRLEISAGVAIVPVFGILGKHLDMLDMMCGGYDLNVLTSQALALQNRGDVDTVILHFNTAGGAAAGVADAAQCLLDLGTSKRLVAYVDEACSGGQWLAAACDEIYIGESAMAGSISAICAVLDESEAYKQEGLSMQVFTDGIHKSAGTPGTSLTPVQSAEIQARIAYIGGQFKSFIRARRPSVTDETMQGQWFYGLQAIELGLADAVAPTLEHVVAHVLN